MVAWKVFYNKAWIDTVFYDDDMSAEDVQLSLINHDGYPYSIVVKKEGEKDV